ncbi:beta-glucosidase [Spirillospora albida]|uniref:beta-glucosidase n=1 Tax=Spirillospora albida TaxID=58123 RepID=UPI000AC598CA|nr:glycoside hydrolase family 3 C-terminal domain-containing protein [Spirillospora albida]
MTDDEKLNLMAGDDLVGPLRAADDPAFRAGTVHGVARLGIPDLHLVDAGSMGLKQGPNTALAAGLSLAATFDTRAAATAAGVVADEAARRGNDIILGPATDLMRVPQGGRTFESYGEDPLLAARMGVSWIRTVQNAGLMAQVKHFPANNQEANRYGVNAVISQRALREIYLPPFEAAVREAKVATVMCGYNLVNGQPSCSNTALLSTVLRKQWGFDGFVVSDWLAAVKNTDGSLKAGLDLEMPVGAFYTPPLLRASLNKGTVTWSDIDRTLTVRLRTMFSYGMFDRPQRANTGSIDYRAHAVTAQKLAEQGITLLKNNGNVLPLRSGTKVAVIGKAADQFRSGIGSMYVKPVSTITPRQGIAARGGAGAVTYQDGQNLAAAVRTARNAQVAVVVVADARAEDADITCLTLKCAGAKDKTLGDQEKLITEVAKANPNTIVVLQTGGPVLTPWAAKVRGIVQAWYAGGHGGAAIARVLYGDVDPGGRLPVSFPARATDAPAAGNPAHYPGTDDKAVYAEGIFVGYRHYDTRNLTPAFPFGHGLSYTTFKLSNLKATRTTVTATVTNTGKRPGYAVPQLYLGLRAAVGAPQPPRQLKGFSKMLLVPGQSAKVTFSLDARALSYWDQSTQLWKKAPGCTKAVVGTSSRDAALSATIC